jgi:hypothetical protein
MFQCVGAPQRPSSAKEIPQTGNCYGAAIRRTDILPFTLTLHGDASSFHPAINGSCYNKKIRQEKP